MHADVPSLVIALVASLAFVVPIGDAMLRHRREQRDAALRKTLADRPRNWAVAAGPYERHVDSDEDAVAISAAVYRLRGDA